jgi:isopenicillin N synthase-like dioxygenase
MEENYDSDFLTFSQQLKVLTDEMSDIDIEIMECQNEETLKELNAEKKEIQEDINAVKQALEFLELPEDEKSTVIAKGINEQ